MTLQAAWFARCSKIAKGNKLCAKGDKLWAEGNNLLAEGNKLYAEGHKLWVEGNKLCAEGRNLWDSTVVSVLGSLNSKQIWMCDNTICLLTDGSMWKVPE
jgi:hypothetical protein